VALSQLPTHSRERFGIEMLQPQYPHSRLQADIEGTESKGCALPWDFSSQKGVFTEVKPVSREETRLSRVEGDTADWLRLSESLVSTKQGGYPEFGIRGFKTRPSTGWLK
jgi:hypothetical protein